MCRAAFAMIPKGFNLLSFVLFILFLTSCRERYNKFRKLKSG